MKTFTFGLIADPQYGEIPSRGSRFYSNSLEKIRRCTEIFQNESVSFAVCLGNMVEGSPNAAKECEDATAALLYGGFPCHFVIGNHDVHAVSRSFLTRLWNYPDDRGYYAFSFGGVLFLVLDTNYNEEGLPSGIDSEGGPCEWTKTYVSEEQLEWIEKTLMNAQEDRAIVFSHSLLDNFSGVYDPHNLRNACSVRKIFAKTGKVTAVFQGHMHSGYQSVSDGICYTTLPGLVETPDRIYAMLVTVSPESLTLKPRILTL